MTQAITIHISDNLYTQLKRTAELSEKPVDTIIAQSLTHSISPLLEDIPQEYQKDVYPLLEMNEGQLQAEARRVFPADHWAEYEALLKKKQNGVLTVQENHRLGILRREADILMFRKGYAVVLLRRRGQSLPAHIAKHQKRAGFVPVEYLDALTDLVAVGGDALADSERLYDADWD